MKPLVVFAMWIGVLAGATALYGAQVEVVRADDKTVQINAGANRGIGEGMSGDVFQETPPIIHPVTKDDLGRHKVRIARIEIREVGPDYAIGRYLLRYAPVKPGDLVSGLVLILTPEEQLRNEVSDARMEIADVARALAQDIKSNQRAIAGLRSTLRDIGSSKRRLRSISNDVRNIRERMVAIETRVTGLADVQKAIVERDTSETSMGVEAGELQVRVAHLESRVDSLVSRPDKSIPAAEADVGKGEGEGEGDDGYDDELGDELGGEEGDGEGGQPPWYEVYWWVALLIGLLGAAALFLLKMMGRKPQGEEGVEETGEGPQEEFLEVGEDETVPEEIPELEEMETAQAEP